jgi:fucose permease
MNNHCLINTQEINKYFYIAKNPTVSSLNKFSKNIKKTWKGYEKMFCISKTLKVDILSKIGYKNGIALGLVISAVGSFLFFPAAQASSFNIMLTGLFILGLGFSLQQTAANPLAIVMGNPATGSQRLSFAGGINNVGTTIGPS